MTPHNMQLNARAEAARGDTSLKAAKVLLEHQLYSDAISRAYYAAYHWVRALLFIKELDPRSHRGTIQLFHLHYQKTACPW